MSSLTLPPTHTMGVSSSPSNQTHAQQQLHAATDVTIDKASKCIDKKSGGTVSNVHHSSSRASSLSSHHSSGFTAAILSLLGCILTQLVNFETQQYPQGRGPITLFHTAYVPSISIASYLKRIIQHTHVSVEAVIQSVLHIHQMMQRPNNPLIVNALNIHRLLLTSIMCTAKYFDDSHYNSAYFSYIGGISLKELNMLEVEFLSLLNFDFYISYQTYAYFYHMIIDANIHQPTTCKCAAYLPHLPKTVKEGRECRSAYVQPSEEEIRRMIEGEDKTASPSVSSLVLSPALSTISTGSFSVSSFSSSSATSSASRPCQDTHHTACTCDDMEDALPSIPIEPIPPRHQHSPRHSSSRRYGTLDSSSTTDIDASNLSLSPSHSRHDSGVTPELKHGNYHLVRHHRHRRHISSSLSKHSSKYMAAPATGLSPTRTSPISRSSISLSVSQIDVDMAPLTSPAFRT